MKYFYLFMLVVCFSVISCKSDKKEETAKNVTSERVVDNNSAQNTLNIQPISHATMVLTYGEDTIYIDPTGGAEAFQSFSKPSYVIITDIHGDHLNIDTLLALDLTSAVVIAPKAVVDEFPLELGIGKLVTLNNGDSITDKDMVFEAIPMYNLREEALKFHTKGRGNGYVLTIGGERIYISGDTEDIPEMRALENIDKAFVCMNLPYTMTVESAADAVLEFKPKTIYPYHYRGTDGLSDVEKFKTLVNQGDEAVEVVQLDWYK